MCSVQAVYLSLDLRAGILGYLRGLVYHEIPQEMNGYTKLFQDIVTSTIWSENSDCRVLWITMLALKGKNNICGATVPALAKIVGISAEETEQYLEKFQQPDKWSRSHEHEGRRIAPVDGGWLILNGEKYQEKMNAEKRKDDVRENVARWRAKHAKEAEKKAPKKRPKKPQIDNIVTNGFAERPPAYLDERHKVGCCCQRCIDDGVVPPEREAF